MKLRGFLLAVKPQRSITETFKVQEFYLDCSNFNNLTGEKYPNYVRLQIANDKASLDGFKPGELLEVEFDVRGRFFNRKTDNTPGHIQELNAFRIDPVINTSGEKIFQHEDQISHVQIPA